MVKSHEQRHAEAIAALTHRLTSWGVVDADDKAREFIRDLTFHGWRTTPATVDRPDTTWEPGDPAAGAAACRAAIRGGGDSE